MGAVGRLIKPNRSRPGMNDPGILPIRKVRRRRLAARKDLVDSVDGSTSRGNACQIGGPFVAIASTAGTDLLSHEMGHDLALTHIDNLTSNFDQTNIMHSASNSRAFATEGQLFRTHLEPTSAVNATYGVRPGQTTRNCPRDTVSRTCPPIQKRLWADGTFPAN